MKTILLSLGLLLAVGLMAQTDELYRMELRVLDEHTRQPIRNVHIINLNRGYGAVTDTSGHFVMLAHPADSIRFSVIGYEVFKTSAVHFLGFLRRQIQYMRPKTYLLQEMQVKAITWNTFKDSVLRVQIPEEKWRDQRWIERYFDKDQRAELNRLAQPQGAIVIPLNYKTGEDRQREEVVNLIEKRTMADLAETRFNKNRVAEITQANGELLDRFFQTLNWDTDKVLSLNDYQLVLEIQKRFRDFTRHKERPANETKP